MLRSVRLGMLATTMLAGMAAGALAQGLVTADHVGKPDAPNTLTMRMNPDQSPGNNPHKEIGAKYAAAWEKWAEAHPDWQVNVEYFSQDIGAEHARLLEQARAGRAPDCVTVNSFQLALFVKNGVLQPLDEYFSKEEIDDLFPFIKEGITGPDGHIYAWWWGTDLRVLYYNNDIVKDVPQTWDELQNDRARGRRRPASTASSSTAAAGRAPPSTGWRTSGPRAASSSTRRASRSSAKARTRRRC